jgi:hypothetical protein
MILAHARCSVNETVSTAVVATVIAVALFRPWRRSMNDTRATTTTRLVLPLVLAAVVTLGGCGGGKTAPTTTSTAGRPETPVQLKIVQPTAGAVTAANVTVAVELDNGGTVVDRTTGPLTSTEGHVHLSVDGKLVSMAYKTTQDLTGLTPGPHTLLAEFVAIDHAPFRNRPQASVIFTVQG